MHKEESVSVMLVTRVFLAAALLPVTFASGERNRSLRPGDDAVPQYYEQCRFVNAWEEHLGHVSVLAFLDPAWPYSYRQAVMLQLLSTRLRKSGFPGVRFFVITPPPGLTDDKGENDVEVEAWRNIAAMSEMRNVLASAGDHRLGDGEPEMAFLQDGPRHRMWTRFRASKDQVVVIDRCGKLTYQVIVPWSILYFPYVKAAILSTHQEDPCGGCDPAAYKSDTEYFSSSADSTDKEADPLESGDVNADPVATTEQLGNLTARFNESLEEEHEADVASSILVDEITNGTDQPDLSRVTESPAESETAESSLDEDKPEERSREELTDSGNGTVSSEAAATEMVEPQTESPCTRIPVDDGVVTANYEDAADRALLLDEPATGEIKSDPTTVAETSAAVGDEARGEEATPVTDAARFEGRAPPLQIIMHAPHVHGNGRKTKKHAYLILKTDNPDFHGHLDSGIEGADFQAANSEERDWGAIEAGVDEESSSDRQYTFDKDESPGLYGEVADYWKSFEDSDITDRNETTNDYNNATIDGSEEHRTVSDHAIKLSKLSDVDESHPAANLTADANIKSTTDSSSTVELDQTSSSKSVNDQDIDRDEEGRNMLIEHYSKLLSWIDYRLHK